MKKVQLLISFLICVWNIKSAFIEKDYELDIIKFCNNIIFDVKFLKHSITIMNPVDLLNATIRDSMELTPETYFDLAGLTKDPFII